MWVGSGACGRIRRKDQVEEEEEQQEAGGCGGGGGGGWVGYELLRCGSWLKPRTLRGKAGGKDVEISVVVVVEVVVMMQWMEGSQDHILK
ncbi:hypothetical protein E2C01_063317 [Portunus trituberculatus]|uniref:Uncharacterized protein n=1 Tax=Portunus trituberculatus TaxID=210409 RepID=A0A5B7HDC7_PORTR|nr:hypothetical protein [Portunus trituberculatus]